MASECLAQIPQHVTQQVSKKSNNSTGNHRSYQIYVTCISTSAATGVRPDAIDTRGSVTTSVTNTIVGPRFTHPAHVFPTYKRSYVYKLPAEYKHKEFKQTAQNHRTKRHSKQNADNQLYSALTRTADDVACCWITGVVSISIRITSDTVD